MNDDLQPIARKVQRAEERREGAVSLDQPHPEDLNMPQPEQPPAAGPAEQPTSPGGAEPAQPPTSDSQPEDSSKTNETASNTDQNSEHSPSARSIAFLGVIGGILLIMAGLFLLVLRLYVAAIIIVFIGGFIAAGAYVMGANR